MVDLVDRDRQRGGGGVAELGDVAGAGLHLAVGPADVGSRGERATLRNKSRMQFTDKTLNSVNYKVTNLDFYGFYSNLNLRILYSF
jgi:hypothetical protein